MLQQYKIQTQPNRIFVFIEFIVLLLMLQAFIFMIDEEKTKEVQFRVIAHSNKLEDQANKQQVQQMMAPVIQELHETTSTTAQFEQQLAIHMPKMVEEMQQQFPARPITFQKEWTSIPPKRLGAYFQPQGQYETHVVKIGSARGDNWWCALFSNVCFPKEDPEEEEEITFFLWEWIKDLFD